MHHRLTALLTAGALLTASTALAQSKQKDKYSEPSYEEAVALTKEDAPEFVKPSPFITPNVRVTGGYGLFSLTGDGAGATNLSGGGVTVAIAAGDEFWDVIGYYVGGRVGLFDPTTIESGGQTFDNYNEKAVLTAEAAVGLDLWIIPQFVGVAAEGVVGVGASSLQPVARADYSLDNEFTMTGGRARASLRLGDVSVNGEYFLMLPATDQLGETWSGWTAAITLSYHPPFDDFGGSI